MWLLIGLQVLKNVNGYFPNHLAFGKYPHFPEISNDLLLASENKTNSQIVGENSNPLNSARQNLIKIKATSKLKLALKRQTRTSFDVL